MKWEDRREEKIILLNEMEEIWEENDNSLIRPEVVKCF